MIPRLDVSVQYYGAARKSDAGEGHGRPDAGGEGGAREYIDDVVIASDAARQADAGRQNQKDRSSHWHPADDGQRRGKLDRHVSAWKGVHADRGVSDHVRGEAPYRLVCEDRR